MTATDAILPYFRQYRDPRSALYQKAFLPLYPSDFVTDVATGQLPAVSWIIPPAGYDEHPSSPPALGEWFTSQVLGTLVSNPEVWSKTVLFHMYDENDGFFDHVPPPVPPAGTAGRVPDASRTCPPTPRARRGPVGIGFRVPMLVLSPFSRGRPRRVGGVRPHVAAALLGGALRRAGSQHLGLAPADGGRPDVDPAPGPSRRVGPGAARARPTTRWPTWPPSAAPRPPSSTSIPTCRPTRCRCTSRCRARRRRKRLSRVFPERDHEVGDWVSRRRR